MPDSQHRIISCDSVAASRARLTTNAVEKNAPQPSTNQTNLRFLQTLLERAISPHGRAAIAGDNRGEAVATQASNSNRIPALSTYSANQFQLRTRLPILHKGTVSCSEQHETVKRLDEMVRDR